MHGTVLAKEGGESNLVLMQSLIWSSLWKLPSPLTLKYVIGNGLHMHLKLMINYFAGDSEAKEIRSPGGKINVHF